MKSTIDEEHHSKSYFLLVIVKFVFFWVTFELKIWLENSKRNRKKVSLQRAVTGDPEYQIFGHSTSFIRQRFITNPITGHQTPSIKSRMSMFEAGRECNKRPIPTGPNHLP